MRRGEERFTGNIVVYKRDRGFGFIESESFPEPLWFHFSYIKDGEKSALYADLNERDDIGPVQVSFQVRKDRRGMQAVSIRPLSPYLELEEFLRSDESLGDAARRRFLDLASMPALSHIDRDATLTQLAVSRIVRSARVWDRLTSIARQWPEAIKRFERPLTWSSSDKVFFVSFVSQIAQVFRSQIEQGLDLDPAVPVVVQPIARIHSPLKCLRDSERVHLVILPDVDTLSQVIEEAPSLVAVSSLQMKMVILLEERAGLAEALGKETGLDVALIPQRVLLESILSRESEHPLIVGRCLRAALPLHKVQPYEVGPAYNETVFAGRAQERKRILESLGDNYAIYGGRKIGKTWFLKDICRWCKKEPYSSTYLPLYVSLQSAECIDDATTLIQEAIDYFAETPLLQSEDTIFGLGQALLLLHKAVGKTVLLALDELDDVLKADGQYRLFGRLRQLQYTYPGAFKFVFAGFKELMSSLSDVASNNPFANWIGKNHFSLGCLSESDLERIVEPLKWVGLEFDTDEIVRKVFELTSGHPYYAQSLCYSVVKARLMQSARSLTSQNIEKLASEEFFSEIFDVFIANLSPLQMLIGKVFAYSDQAFTEEDILDELQRRFSIEISPKQLREEMKVLQACSVFIRRADGYRPVAQRINREFFQGQDDTGLAVRYLEELDGIQSASENPQQSGI